MIEQQLRYADGSTVDASARTSDEQLRLILEAASSGFEIWRHITMADRACIVRKIAQLLRSRTNEFARLLSIERNTSLSQAIEEVILATDRLHDYAACTARMLAFLNLPDNPDKAWSEHRPVGVLIGVSKPNPALPLHQLARFCGPNLMAGNTVMIQHPERAPASAVGFDELLREAGGFAGMFANVKLSAEQLERAARDPRVQRVVPLTYPY